MSQLYLVGSVHWDLKGPQRLRKFLDFVRPSNICLEASEEYVKKVLSDRELIKIELEKEKKFNTLMNSLYTASGQTEKIKKDIGLELKFIETLGYETWTSFEHKKEENPDANIIPIEDHELLIKGQTVYKEGLGEKYVDPAGNFTSQFMDDVSKDNLDAWQKSIDNLYVDSDTYFEKNPEAKEIIPSVKERDEKLEIKLRDVVDKNSGTTVFVCGTNHFFADYGNLYDRIKDLFPIRVRLSDVDKY